MRIQEALEAISEGALDTTLNVNEFHGRNKKMAEEVVGVGNKEFRTTLFQ